MGQSNHKVPVSPHYAAVFLFPCMAFVQPRVQSSGQRALVGALGQGGGK